MSVGTFFQELWVIFQELTFTNIVDLFLVWIVVYRVLLFTKSSGSLQVILGITFIALIYGLSILFELATFNWLLEAFFSQLFLIVFILFQKEIRQALAQIGSSPFFPHSKAVSSLQAGSIVDELSKGLIQLGQKGIGALVVLEREMDLDYYIEIGVSLNSEVRSEILLSIFNPQGPTHDGAVVIRGGKIAFSGCFLPLSNNPALDRDLGTRHRAALGLSEETDATIFVVSEENKAVLCVEKGKLSNPMNHAELREKMYQVFVLKG